MSTKTSLTDRADYETQDIEIQIGIIRQSIDNLTHAIYISDIRGDMEYIPELKKKLKEEEKNLQEFKEKYPEYFI